MKKIAFTLLVTIFVTNILIVSIYGKRAIVVRTNKGRVAGRVLVTVQSNKEYIAFKGIPYAKPPTGYRRFKVKNYLFC